MRAPPWCTRLFRPPRTSRLSTQLAARHQLSGSSACSRCSAWSAAGTPSLCYAMDPRISAHFVRLDPEDSHQWKLCQLVVDYTHDYLERVALLEIDQDSGPRPVCQLWAKAQCKDLMAQLSAYVAHLEQGRAESKLPIRIKAAWRDWHARQSAFAGTSIGHHPVYLVALAELVRDLKHPPHLPGLEAKDCGLAHVAILVSSFPVSTIQ
jgi:hypothetical protein